MRFTKNLLEKIEGDFFGPQKSIGRVTVEPLWQLNATPPTYGGSVRGPFRWWQDKADSGVEWEVPNIKSISWDRSESQDIATCTITLYNIWHEGNLEVQEMGGQLGKPGYFWPKRGLEFNRWNQIGGKGSFRKDGFWDPNFSWQNVLVPYALIRTYEGYGPGITPDRFIPITEHLSEENVLITGTWLVDSVSANSNGEMTLSCRDIGKLLLDQICFPPTVPGGLYPLDYYPAGKSPFDSQFGSKPKTGVSPASMGEVLARYSTSSYDVATGVPNSGNGTFAVDGNWSTFAISNGFANPGDGSVWWEFNVNQQISKLSIKPWAGGYQCYVSLNVGGSWVGGQAIPNSSVPCVTLIDLPLAAPDGMEPVTYIDIPSPLLANQANGTKSIYVDSIRITMRHLYYSTNPVGAGDYGVYRGGIRDFLVYREGNKVSPYNTDFSTLPWTYSMTAHPTRGYWVVDNGGTVHGFGDAADYDSSGFDRVPVELVHPNNQIIAMTPHPDGKGYWCVDITGRVYHYGSAGWHGEYVVTWPGTDKWGEDGVQAWDITSTYTGNGYWVIYGNGEIHGFGDAAPAGGGSLYAMIPWTQVGTFMYTVVSPHWLGQRHGNGICSHPNKLGFWATTGSGEVFAYGEAQHFGQLHNRVYNAGMADTFRLGQTEFTRSIESTKSGNGYWIAFGSGHIAAFGDAVGQGPTYIYPQNNPGIQVAIDETDIVDWGFFRALVWDLARDPDGSGFWVLIADGGVKSYNAEFWGSPGWSGLTGYRWHEGNYKDYSDIIKDILSWAGWTFYNAGDTVVDIFGNIESTGVMSDTALLSDKFDKRPLLDIIKELCEVVAYVFQIREDGGVVISSKNVWRSGNFDEDGYRIYVKEGTLDRTTSSDPDAVEFIPIVDEMVDLFDYQTTLNSSSMRSEIIIGTDQPDPKYPHRTGFTKFVPQSATEELAPGVKLMRNIPRPAMWVNQMFTNPEEQRLMAELIALNSWFSERVSSASCVANPCLSVGDQIRFAERNTSEYNVHYITGISSDHDLDTGIWTYSLQTHWLGDEDNWVITADNVAAPVDGRHFVQISEPVDRWQQLTNRGLQKGGLANGGSGASRIFTGFGAFSESLIAIGNESQWSFVAEGSFFSRYDSLEIVLEEKSAPLSFPVTVEFALKDGPLVAAIELSELNQAKTLITSIGANESETKYVITLKGYTSSVGNGFIRWSIIDNDIIKKSFEGSILVVG